MNTASLSLESPSIHVAIMRLIASAVTLLERFGAPLLDMSIRLYMANIFFTSGWQKFTNFDSAIFLFTYEHPVPGLSPQLAAYMGTAGELVLPVLLVLGLGGRVAAGGLLIMTAIIEFTYQHSTDHIFWAFLLGTIFLRGPGILSIDHLIRRKMIAKNHI